MKVESRTIVGAAIFLALASAVYWGMVEYHGAADERAGIAMLVFSFAGYTMLGIYLLAQYYRRKGIPRPEDRFDADQSDGEGLVGYFPSASIWPAGMALGMIFGAAALIWGLWYLAIGAVLFFGAVVGWVVESDHTEYVEAGAPVDSVEEPHHEATPTKTH
jgi:hypothetical protein